jgi:hypothetical protein
MNAHISRTHPLLFAVAFGLMAGSLCGGFFGFTSAAAVMLGDAEIYPPDALPPAPDAEEWLRTGAAIGAVVGVILGPFAWAIWSVTKRAWPPAY